MKVLLIRPEDGLLSGPWAASTWDRIIDLGHAGADSYQRAADCLGSRVTLLDDLRDGFKEIHRVRELLRVGLGRLTDGFQLDWWELTAIRVHFQLESVILLRKFVDTLEAGDEIHISGPGFYTEALRLMLGSRLRVFPPHNGGGKRGADHYFRVLRKFPAGQLLGILWDKYDPGYQFRGLMSSGRKPQDAPVVLLPTAYVNVSRTGIAYATVVPDVRFLMVATRSSGSVKNPPRNVSTAWLRSYASVRVPARDAEFKDVMKRWGSLRKEIENVEEFQLLSRLGFLSRFADWFARGLEIRDAWRNVLDAEPVQAVLCADDSNPYTHIPLLLAKERGLRTISCHHGALDGRYMFKRCHADVILAKGRMEEDYLVRLCGVPGNRNEVGAPILVEDRKQETCKKKKNSHRVIFRALRGDGRTIGGRLSGYSARSGRPGTLRGAAACNQTASRRKRFRTETHYPPNVASRAAGGCASSQRAAAIGTVR